MAISLQIDGKEAALKKGSSIEYVSENRIFTDADDYSLEIETAAIEKRYEREVSMAEGNKYKTKQLEKQKQKEVAKVKDEANRKLFAMQVIQAVAQTAMAALNAYSSAAAIPLARLNERLNEPFVTVNTVTGDKGINQAQDDYQRLMNNKSPKNKRK